MIFPKKPKKKKPRKPLLQRSLKKLNDGRKCLENACMDLWRKIVSFGKDRCEWCGKVHSVYHCHHIISKGSCAALKYDPLNGIYLGAGCHLKVHTTGAMDFSRWLDREFPGRYDKLCLRRSNLFKNSKSNLELVKISLQNESNELKEGK